MSYELKHVFFRCPRCQNKVELDKTAYCIPLTIQIAACHKCATDEDKKKLYPIQGEELIHNVPGVEIE